MISGLYGGRLAEEIIFGKENVSTGASNDIERATGIAKNMVLEWGFTSDEKNEDAPRLYTADGPMGKQIDASPEMLAKLDGKIKEVLNSNYETARKVLDENMDKLHVMSEALLKYETIDVDMIAEIMAGKSFEDLSRPSWWTNAEEAAYQGKNQQDDVVSDATPADADETD
jgi:cell division protease FtsH